MSAGRLIAVVGPSGVGKDSVMVGLATACPEIKLVRRTITRASELGGEDYDATTPARFAELVGQGAFCVHWGAHDLRYGIPARVLREVENGQTCLANFSRGALGAARAIFPDLTVLNLTARPETLRARLAARGRETAAQIDRRLAQADKPLPPGFNVITISNDGPLSTTVASALASLHPVRA